MLVAARGSRGRCKLGNWLTRTCLTRRYGTNGSLQAPSEVSREGAKSVLVVLPSSLQFKEEFNDEQRAAGLDETEIRLREVLKDEREALGFEFIHKILLAISREISNRKNGKDSVQGDAAANLVLADAKEGRELVSSGELDQLASRKGIDFIRTIVSELEHVVEGLWGQTKRTFILEDCVNKGV